MTPKLEKVPEIVKRLADEQKMHPIKWRIEEDEIVIIFQEGPKMSFPRPGKELTGPKPPAAAPIAAGSEPPAGVSVVLPDGEKVSVTRRPRRRK